MMSLEISKFPLACPFQKQLQLIFSNHTAEMYMTAIMLQHSFLFSFHLLSLINDIFLSQTFQLIPDIFTSERYKGSTLQYYHYICRLYSNHQLFKVNQFQSELLHSSVIHLVCLSSCPHPTCCKSPLSSVSLHDRSACQPVQTQTWLEFPIQESQHKSFCKILPKYNVFKLFCISLRYEIIGNKIKFFRHLFENKQIFWNLGLGIWYETRVF